MTITEVKRLRRQLCRLTLDSGDSVELDARAFEESGYREGDTLSETELAELLRQAQQRRARETALYLLSVRERSRRELEEKLRQEAPPELAEATARQMEELGLVDDVAYAARLARDLRTVKCLSESRTVQELRRRGIDRETAQEAASSVETTDLDGALALLRRKRYNRECDEATRRRMAALLSRSGYDYDTVRRALDAGDGETDDGD